MKGCPPSIVWSSRVNALHCRKASRYNLRTRTIWIQTPTTPPRVIYLPLTDQPRSAQEQNWTGLWRGCPAQCASNLQVTDKKGRKSEHPDSECYKAFRTDTFSIV